MVRIIVEQVFDPPMSDAAFAELASRLEPCLKARGCAWKRSYVSSDRTRMICDYEAPDAESVREACRSAGHPFTSVWSAGVFTIEDNPQLKAQLIAKHEAAKLG
jgi:hypothetical protein